VVDTDTLAVSMGYSDTFTENLVSMNQKHLSLDTPSFADSTSSLLDNIICGNFDTPDKEVENKSLYKFIADSMTHLSPKEKKVLTFTFGLGANKQLNLTEVGELIGLSKERVRQIKEEALEKLRNVVAPKKHLKAA
jgi:RNA polymerase primary sigma factor